MTEQSSILGRMTNGLSSMKNAVIGKKDPVVVKLDVLKEIGTVQITTKDQAIDYINKINEKLKNNTVENPEGYLIAVAEGMRLKTQSLTVPTGVGGGKSKKRQQKGGMNPVIGAPIMNTSSLGVTMSPDVQVAQPVGASFAPLPFSAGMPVFASLESAFPDDYQRALSGGIQSGGMKNKKSKGKGKK